ncbi:Hypothetical predicted protein [Mytilus galloprovincialis]|uniref:Uncharacterized protein n=1 Tax=Mytilus galloprovincialis TaxID=29158 RepID=A0A8B6DM74_MYTGA|nr:Hypothetical predicted protein [Mytilus galloprovincialis]
MASKPGLSNVLNIKPTSSLRYTKYFPNNLEYANKVYPHREAETQTEDEIIVNEKVNHEWENGVL